VLSYTIDRDALLLKYTVSTSVSDPLCQSCSFIKRLKTRLCHQEVTCQKE